jgi:hypothetical protein
MPERTASGDLLCALTLLGSFAFAYNAAVVLHELGHIAAALIGGGTVRSLLVHPLGTSAVAVAPDPRPLLTAAGGPFLGALGSLAIGTWARRHDSAAPLVALGAIGPLASGTGLLVGASFGFGDAVELERGGVPLALSAIAGLLVGAVGACQVRPALGAVGMHRAIAPRRRALILLLGVGSYLAAIAAWTRIADPSEANPWMLLVTAGAVLALASISSWATPTAAAPVGGDRALSALAMGAVAIVMNAVVL